MAALINNNLTSAGLLLLAKGAAGEQIKYTRIVLGDGELPDGTTIPGMTDVIHPRVTVDISAIKVIGDGTVQVTGIFTNQDIDEGFYYRELGLYAEDPDNGEIMYCYGNAGSNPEYIPPTGGNTIIEKQVDVITAIGSAVNVTAYIPADAYATKQDYEDLKKICYQAMDTANQANKTSDNAVQIANQALSMVIALSNQVTENTMKINTLWNAMFSQVAAHPFQVLFRNLDDADLSTGNYNETMARVEC